VSITSGTARKIGRAGRGSGSGHRVKALAGTAGEAGKARA
jgi:hypothetical protein